MTMSSSTGVFAISLLAIPLTYIVNSAQDLHGEVGLFVSGVVALTTICILTYLFLGRKGHKVDPLYYVLTVCTFGGVSSLIIALEGDGVIQGFMSNYLKEGEPYLKTAHGTMISYWDGMGHYPLCLMVAAALSWNSVSVLTLTCFSSMADLLIGLENDGRLSGFMTNYLKDGEPYLTSAHGVAICYWDGTGHYVMYLLMLAALARNQSYREVGLYWAGSIGHSMVVFMPGNVVGKYGIRPSFLLNVPYCIIPFAACARFLRERPNKAQHDEMAELQHTSIWKRPVDIFFILTLIISACVAFLRGFAVLGCTNDFFVKYIEQIEPYLTDPVAYPKIQMLVYLFYFVPYYVVAIYGLLYPGNDWMPDWALIHAGAAIQGQVSHIGASFHTRTQYILRVPGDPTVRMIFWIINGGLLVLPQLLAYRTCQNHRFFTKAAKDKAERPKIE